MKKLIGFGLNTIGTSRKESTPYLHWDLEYPNDCTIPENIGMAYFCAGITSTKACEGNPEKSRQINVINTLVLINRLLKNGTHVVYLSSDLAQDASTEYGRQKSELEKNLDVKNVTIVRMGKVLEKPTSLYNNWLQTIKNGKPIEVFDDLYFSPLLLNQIVELLVDFEKLKNNHNIWVTATPYISHYQAVKYLSGKLGLNEKLVHPVRSDTKRKRIWFEEDWSIFRYDSWKNMEIKAYEGA